MGMAVAFPESLHSHLKADVLVYLTMLKAQSNICVYMCGLFSRTAVIGEC